MPPDAEYSKVAPLKILSFDIECCSKESGEFPDPTKDPIIQIANTG
jgi:DNA polymerase delta subunit 1